MTKGSVGFPGQHKQLIVKKIIVMGSSYWRYPKVTIYPETQLLNIG